MITAPEQACYRSQVLSSFADGQLFGERFGEEQPDVLALHGWGRTHEDFAAVLPGLNAVALDLPGFGASPEPAQPVAAGDIAFRIEPVLNVMNKPVVVIGHSLGGRVAIKLAMSKPESIKCIVLVGTPVVRDPGRRKKRAPIRFRLLKRLNTLGLVSDSIVENAKKKYGSVDYRRSEGVMRDSLVRIVNETYENESQLIKCPVYLVWAQDDPETPIGIAHRALELFSNATLFTNPDGGHLLPFTRPQAVRDVLDKVIAS